MINTEYFYIDEFENDIHQNLNLSENAWAIINEDKQNFYDSKDKESLAGFLNRIFANFYQSSDASINLRVIDKIDELSKLKISKEFAKIDTKAIDLFIMKLAKIYERELIEKSLSYKKGHPKKFRINVDNVDILRESSEAHHYNNRIGLYLKAIYEEYASKPSYIREQIFFKDTLTVINRAIKEERRLKIVLNKRTTMVGNKTYYRKFYFYPYKIVQDKTNTFNYLVGYSEEIIEVPDKNGCTSLQIMDKTIASIRLSRIEKINIYESRGAHISKENIEIIEKALRKSGPQFLTGEIYNVKVLFTDKGLESLKRQLYMRPQNFIVDKNDSHIYYFSCNEIQAINYFFKFGWDAQILEPQSLRDKFLYRYETALMSYKGFTKEEIIESFNNSSKKKD